MHLQSLKQYTSQRFQSLSNNAWSDLSPRSNPSQNLLPPFDRQEPGDVGKKQRLESAISANVDPLTFFFSLDGKATQPYGSGNFGRAPPFEFFFSKRFVTYT